ncbi:metal-dependent transcriptional regulator [Echinicola rosea]|uniref:metal-dependent transcriptional regulator n=2 Tax=Echinicola TaxID=390846 RepID=UPI0021D21431|nr:metal-dependent transcriptional regulator [Echinicola rosea]
MSTTGENYLKAIFFLEETATSVTVSAVAEKIQNSPASASDMLRRLYEKGLIEDKNNITLTDQGSFLAKLIIRKHRLWETFLVETLNFKWDEVHTIAEQLEHVQSSLFRERLERFLEYPERDPHVDPIPDKDGNFPNLSIILLSELEPDKNYVFRSVDTDDKGFLNHLDKGLQLGQRWVIIEKEEFDMSVKLLEDDKNEVYLSERVAKNLNVCLSEHYKSNNLSIKAGFLNCFLYFFRIEV